MKKPYVKNLGEYEGKEAFLVDAFWTRQHVSADFPEYGTHYSMSEIPKDEIWVGSDVDENEYDYWIREGLAEYRYCERGKSEEKAEDEAANTEYSFHKHIKDGEAIKQKLYGRVGPISIYLVDGEAVRDRYNSDWQDGGHGYIYDYIPKTEIWLDDHLHPFDLKCILLHEIHEMNRMRFNHWPYLRAHNEANKFESKARKNPKLIDGMLKTEFQEAV
jgi:hypothetical protein